MIHPRRAAMRVAVQRIGAHSSPVRTRQRKTLRLVAIRRSDRVFRHYYDNGVQKVTAVFSKVPNKISPSRGRSSGGSFGDCDLSAWLGVFQQSCDLSDEL